MSPLWPLKPHPGRTSSPPYCKDAVVFNAKQCWGFVTTTEHFANPQPFAGSQPEAT